MDTAAIRGEWVGRVVDERFPLSVWLGGSEHSAVYLTEIVGDPSRKAAIKLTQVDDRDADACIADWAAVKTLAHTHLTRLLHTGRCQIHGQPLIYAVTEYADEVLSEILLERALTAGEAEEMLGPLLDALQFLHGKGLVHGRLKPSNILVIADQLKISSDGIQSAGGHIRQFAKGSPYDAPELSTQAISPAADIWSLGMTLVEALTQRLPAWDRSATNDPDLPQSIPQPLAALVRGCLRADPARRYTLDQVRACLQPGASPAVEITHPVATRREIKGSGIKGNEPSKPQSLRLPAVVVTIVGLAVVAVLAIRSHKASPPLPAESNQPPVSTSTAPVQPAPPPPAATPETHPASASTVKGAVADRVMPDIPSKATATIQGKVAVEIHVTVNAGGEVSDAVVESDGHGRYFANLALEAVRNWKFTPPQVDGHAVPSEWTLRFVFRQTGTEVTTVETAPE